ncbi:hypothetical protein AAV94_11125 [Lampropedia cohaerens]|uniref:Rap1a immunity protein domain-containing protein n=1 Tax=Lampropedia cohaerens TaxID=1610491 RepID=A0A0U1PXY3_9BURK|nr:hypothetical protein [Lampropedia cohaerens]KKW67384.1 hypothetical protein AAV94_11125 [Lampropedia cohaerens]
MVKVNRVYKLLSISSLAFLLVCQINHANASVSDENREKCAAVSDIAASVMELRQMGALMNEVLGDGGSPVEEIHNLLVERAYKMPRFPESMVDEVVRDFQNEIFMECYSANRK